jgi:hypothetical protein
MQNMAHYQKVMSGVFHRRNPRFCIGKGTAMKQLNHF